MMACLRILLILITASGCAPMVRAEFFKPAEVVSGKVFVSASVGNADSAVEIRWTYAAQALEAGVFSGVKVYRLRDGDEMRYRVDPLALIEDVGSGDSLKVTGLRNGSRVIFVIRAHDEAGKVVEEIRLFGFPGSSSKEAPSSVANLYAAAGAFAISVFWDRSGELDLTGYEILRRRYDEDVFSVLGRLDKVAFVDGRRTGAALSGLLPEIQPTMFRDRSALPGLKYVYQVRAVDSAGNTGPSAETPPVTLAEDRSPIAEEVLILASWSSSESKDVAREYARKRSVPEKNILIVTPSKGHKYRNHQIVEEVREHLLANDLAGKVRIIVPTFGIPLGDGIRALDSLLADPFGRFSWGRVMGTPNPSFGQNMHHDPSLGTYLVSRLDGPTSQIAVDLVDKALAAERTVTARAGAAFFTNPDFMKECVGAAKRHGVAFVSKDTSFTKNNSIPEDTMWFFGSGHPYREIRTSPWPDGAVAGFLKSDTLARIRDKKSGYWVQGFLEEGITATYGAAIEPYVQGYTRGDILLDRFWSGRYTFAEAFAMATPTLRWAMIAVGDPLYKIKSE